jgi:UDP-N-acetylmuramoyl-tripeptide--D-alanyl-D-alanine ligase
MRGVLVTALGTTLTLDDVAAATSGALSSGRRDAPLGGVSIDSRTVAPGELFVAIVGPRFDGHDFLAEAASRGAVAALVHRAAAAPRGLALIRVADTTRALADIARRVRSSTDVPVVCITGSAGKTTTKNMAAALLETRGPVLKTEGNLNNQYGLPLTLVRLGPEHSSAVLELGMSAPGELRGLSAIAQPDVAVITNVGPAHLGFFPSVDAIAEAKAEILEGLRPGGAAVLNGDDPRLRRIGERSGREVVWFGRHRRHDVSAENWRGSLAGMRFDLRLGGRTVDVALPLAGIHHVMNFLAAAAVAHRLGIGADAIAEAATRMEPAPHRGQVLRRIEGVVILDDSYNASPDAVEAAVTALGLAGGRRRVAFLGDMLELGETGPRLHREVGERLGGRVDVIVGVGPMAKDLVEGARAAGFGEEALSHFPDSTSAATAAPDLARAGDAILVKGSRGMRMERVVQALLGRFGAEGESSVDDER